MNVEIRRLHPGDDALVKQVADEVFDEPVRPDRLAAYLASPGHFMIVAIVDEIVGGQRMTPKIGIDFRKPSRAKPKLLQRPLRVQKDARCCSAPRSFFSTPRR